MNGYAAVEVPVTLVRVTCTVCQHDVPVSEAVVAEAVDYVVHFCGLDCYERWRNLKGAR